MEIAAAGAHRGAVLRVSHDRLKRGTFYFLHFVTFGCHWATGRHAGKDGKRGDSRALAKERRQAQETGCRTGFSTRTAAFDRTDIRLSSARAAKRLAELVKREPLTAGRGETGTARVNDRLFNNLRSAQPVSLRLSGQLPKDP